ncbi:MAG: DUF86 domain-containing protein [Deltaproteobacteria bacterium]|nr:DUF86 domain-containing protein [Deltaproteobacteria bacterium]
MELTRQRFGDAFEVLQDDFVYKNAVAMNVLRSGELATLLSMEFKLAHGHIPWSNIIGTRSIAAHNYTKFDIQIWPGLLETSLSSHYRRER